MPSEAPASHQELGSDICYRCCLRGDKEQDEGDVGSGMRSGRVTNIEGEVTLVQLADQPDHLIEPYWHVFCVGEVEHERYPE